MIYYREIITNTFKKEQEMKICYLSDAGSAHTLKWSEFFLEKGYEVIVISLGDGEIPGAKVYSCEVEGFRSRSDINKLFI